MVFTFYIELEESSPLVWRRIVVPANYTFYKLHMVLQGAFGWENCHLFQFSENGLGDEHCYGIPIDNDEPDPEYVKINAKKAKISRVFVEKGKTLCYIYDFGDSWKHRITFEGIETKDIDFPYCVGGAGACPPEDVGSMDGYNRMLEIFKAADHPEIMEYREWLGLVEGENWNASFCSIREVNKRLCLLE
jgi:hypothetical protein